MTKLIPQSKQFPSRERKLKLYSIQWFVNGKLMESIPMNKPYGLCKWKCNELKKGAYSTGKLIIVEHK